MKKKITLDLRCPEIRRNDVDKALKVIDDYLSQPNIANVIRYWLNMPPHIRDEICARSPMIARLREISRIFREDNI
ncbi:MAG TPA: hypothetical protein PLK04_11535 [Bacillota bacterium]|nr:hypothetical protein [Bacillota bacterium]